MSVWVSIPSAPVAPQEGQKSGRLCRRGRWRRFFPPRRLRNQGANIEHDIRETDAHRGARRPRNRRIRRSASGATFASTPHQCGSI